MKISLPEFPSGKRREGSSWCSAEGPAVGEPPIPAAAGQTQHVSSGAKLCSFTEGRGWMPYCLGMPP